MLDYSYLLQNILTNSESVGAPTGGVPIYTQNGPQRRTRATSMRVPRRIHGATKTCKNPEASHGWSFITFFQPSELLNKPVGVEGVHYTIENGELTPQRKRR
jgi:hypothetical protein